MFVWETLLGTNIRSTSNVVVLPSLKEPPALRAPAKREDVAYGDAEVSRFESKLCLLLFDWKNMG